MIVKNDNLYNLSQTAEILGITTQRLFEVAAAPGVEKVNQENRLYFTKESLRKLVLRGDL